MRWYGCEGKLKQLQNFCSRKSVVIEGQGADFEIEQMDMGYHLLGASYPYLSPYRHVQKWRVPLRKLASALDLVAAGARGLVQA